MESAFYSTPLAEIQLHLRAERSGELGRGTEEMIGETIAHYHITAKLGEGGMGEVYRAADTKLGREVALKILPAHFALDSNRMARFTREAQVLASLNHPNIAAIYGVEDRALVMELVEGESPKGPMAFEDAWKIASQIASALEYAHEKGIVHRDLKPANVKVTPDGVVKLLDFGLAKAFTEPKEPSASVEQSPTLTIGATEVGVILGTAAYMAPEQAKGKSVDKRADIWAFGVVLYELLTGERLFKGEDTSETLAQVLTKQPDFGRSSAKARRLLRKCLEKDPKERLRDIGDAKELLEEPPQSMALSHSRVPWAVAGALGLALIVLGALFWRGMRPIDRPLVRLDVDLGTDVSLGSLAGANAILSPDGSRLAYVSHNRLHTRRLDQARATELPGSEGAHAPFFSPDSRWVAFFVGGKLKKVSAAGGAAIVLCNAPFGIGGSWGEDGTIIAALYSSGGLSRIPADGGAPAPLTELDREHGDRTHRWPQILPGGKTVLFTANTNSYSGFDDASIEVMSLGDRHKKTLMRGGTYGRYLPSGHLLYVNRGTLFAVPFDPGALEVRGAPTPVLNQVAYSSNNGDAEFEASQTGTLVYESGGPRGGSVTVQWLESDGKTRALLPKPSDYGRPSLSPDGRRLAIEIREGSNQDIWVYDLGRDTMTRMTFDGKVNQGPIWSPDGHYIVYGSQEGLFCTRADGAGKPQPLIRTKDNVFPWSFTPNGNRLAYHELDPETANDIWTVPLENDGTGLRAGKREVFLQTPSDERNASFSPDGHWLAYVSNESGNFQVYVRTFPDTGAKWQISSEGGAYPMWSRSGRELLFESLDNRIMVAGYTVQGDSFVPDKPRLWSEKTLVNTVHTSKNVDLASDGKRVVALMQADGPEAQQSQHQVVFLENFFDELRRRAPVKR
jgi:serine/threonine-protein kinase